MAYEVHSYEDGQTLFAKALNEMDAQIKRNQSDIPDDIDLVKKSPFLQEIQGDLVLTDSVTDPDNPQKVQVAKRISELSNKTDGIENLAKSDDVAAKDTEVLKSAKEYANTQDTKILRTAKEYAEGLSQGLKMRINGEDWAMSLFADDGVPSVRFTK